MSRNVDSSLSYHRGIFNRALLNLFIQFHLYIHTELLEAIDLSSMDEHT